MPPAQVLTAIQCKSYVDLQAHLEAGGSFVDSDGHLLESTVLADDAIAMKLLLRGNCGLLGGDGRAVVCAARHGRGRVIHVFRSHEDWAKLPATAVDSAFSAAVLGRHAECLDVLLSTDRVSPELLIGGFRQLLSAGSLVGSDVLGDYMIDRLRKLDVSPQRPGRVLARARSSLNRAVARQPGQAR